MRSSGWINPANTAKIQPIQPKFEKSSGLARKASGLNHPNHPKESPFFQRSAMRQLAPAESAAQCPHRPPTQLLQPATDRLVRGSGYIVEEIRGSVREFQGKKMPKYGEIGKNRQRWAKIQGRAEKIRRRAPLDLATRYALVRGQGSSLNG